MSTENNNQPSQLPHAELLSTPKLSHAELLSTPSQELSTDDWFTKIELIEQAGEEANHIALNDDIPTTEEAITDRLNVLTGVSNEETSSSDSVEVKDEIKLNDANIQQETSETEVVIDNSSENTLDDKEDVGTSQLIDYANSLGIKDKGDLEKLSRAYYLSKENPLSVEEAKFVDKLGILEDKQTLAIVNALQAGEIQSVIKTLVEKHNISLDELKLDEIDKLDTEKVETPSNDENSDNFYAFVNEIKSAKDEEYILDNFLSKASDDDVLRIISDDVLSSGFKNHIKNGTIEVVNERISQLEANDSIAGRFRGLDYVDKYIAASHQLKSEHQQNAQQQNAQQQNKNQAVQQEHVMSENEIASHMTAMHQDQTGSVGNNVGDDKFNDVAYRTKIAKSDEYMNWIDKLYNS